MQAGVIPAVAQRFFADTGGALYEQGRIAADGSSEVFAYPGFGGAGHAEQ
jgi:hypothetical protein